MEHASLVEAIKNNKFQPDKKLSSLYSILGRRSERSFGTVERRLGVLDYYVVGAVDELAGVPLGGRDPAGCAAAAGRADAARSRLALHDVVLVSQVEFVESLGEAVRVDAAAVRAAHGVGAAVRLAAQPV
ncbi:hypothetical protein EVAR_11129_1 [Eumeta japonica]|uniref:Uncharacterized protein n=1 Tax=Eumeta variegata TaxID=151549 RepID=A0A4C1U4B1_EUMVA|nr:hypothetical protein EVAR_11129_1 [Eumeta japonica]